MEGLNIGEIVAVSRYWTPQHIDMTYAKVDYARTKPSWIDRLDEHRTLARTDWRDRNKRRALHSKSYVTPEEIRALPPLAATEPTVVNEEAPALRVLRSWFSSLTDEPQQTEPVQAPRRTASA